MFRDFNNFLPKEASSADAVTQVEKLEFILEFYQFPQLESFRRKLENYSEKGIESLLLVFDEEHLACSELKAASLSNDSLKLTTPSEKPVPAESKPAAPWSIEDSGVLTKAVNQFPGGVSGRWEKIAEHVTKHSSTKRTAKECIAEAKRINDERLKKSGNQSSVSGASVSKKEVKTVAKDEKINLKKDDLTETAAKVPTMVCPANDDWSVKQQLQLEEGLRKFPAQSFLGNPGERWVKIAGLIPDRSVKQIKARMKTLQECQRKAGK